MKKLLTFLALSTLLSTSAVAEDAAHSHGLMIAAARRRIAYRLYRGHIACSREGPAPARPWEGASETRSPSRNGRSAAVTAATNPSRGAATPNS